MGPYGSERTPVWHYYHTQSQHLESIQKRALHIIFNFTPGFPYSFMNLFVAGLNSLEDKQHNLSRSFFFKTSPNLIPASITSSHLSVIHLSFLGHGPPHITLAHPHALKNTNHLLTLHLIITSHLLLLRFTSSYHYSLHPSYSPVQYYPFNHCINSIAFHN